MAQEVISQRRLTGERALLWGHDLKIADTVFADGESPLKHARDVGLERVVFEWKYPLWYARNVVANACVLTENARSGIWYTDQVSVADSLIAAPKTFRRSKNIRLSHVDLPNAQETMWGCSDIELNDVSARGDYFGMNSSGIVANGLRLTGNYGFDGGSNIEVSNSTLMSKDAFWNCHDVVVRDSTIIGEYLGWNSSNLTFINCTIESLQGLCYIDNLVMRGCRLINTTLAFEYSTVDAEIDSRIGSIINPTSGVIRCQGVDEVILEADRVDTGATSIVVTGGDGR
ncbi:MAG: DUF3737 family protein [Propionibacteriaceae bacterium]|nr:DUF3737 family protein [Propionibacteriaceae bacterium]